MREQCIELLRKEAIMLDVWSRQPEELPPKSKSGVKAVMFAILTIVTWFVKNWAVNMRDASAEANKYLLILFMGILGWVCWAGLVAFAALAIGKVSQLKSEQKLTAKIVKSNKKLAQDKAESRRAYDELLNKVKEERKNHPELAGKHLFFDDPHPLEQTEKLVRGKHITGKGRLMAVDGELALELGENGLRLNGFYAPKKALIGEVCKGLEGPMGNYALPVWDKEYIDTHPQEECLIYTIHLYRIQAAPTDNRENKIQDPAAEFSRYWMGDVIGGFVGAGVSDVKNLSKVTDLRGLEKMKEMHKYYQTIRNNPKLESAEGRRHGWNVMDYMRLGYMMVKADGSNQMLGVILPRQELDRTVFVYSLDLFYTEKEAQKQKMGRVVDIFRDVSDTRGLGPDITDALWTALVAEEGIVPPFDPLQQPVKNLSSAEWHAMLRLQAVESRKNAK